MQSPRPIGASSQIVKIDVATPMSNKMTNAETSSSITHGNGQSKFPMPAKEAAKLFHNYLTEYERKEINDYQTVYYFNV
jgi:hypothetical protein